MPRYRLKEDQRITNSDDSLGLIIGKAGQEVNIMQAPENSDLVVVVNKYPIYGGLNSEYSQTAYYTLKSNIEEIPESKPKISIYSPSDKKIDNEPFYCGPKLNIIAITLNRFREGDISMQDAYDTIVNDAVLSKIFDSNNTGDQ